LRVQVEDGTILQREKLPFLPAVGQTIDVGYVEDSELVVVCRVTDIHWVESDSGYLRQLIPQIRCDVEYLIDPSDDGKITTISQLYADGKRLIEIADRFVIDEQSK
jgi:hypothetical protein